MRYGNDEGRYFLETLQARAQSKFEQVRRSLLPDSPSGMTVEELQDALLKRMDELPEDRRAEMKIKAGIALVELDVMAGELRKHLTAIGHEVASTGRKTAAAGAYGRVSRLTAGGKSNAW